MAFSISYTYQLLDRFSPALEKIRRGQQRFNDTLKRGRKNLQNFSDGMTNMQTALAGLGGIMVGYQVLETFNRFERAMNQLSAVSMGTRDQMNKFRETALELGATTRFTAAEVAEGMIYLKMAGLSAGETLEAITGMLNLAAAGNIDLGTAADLATNVLLQQGLAVDQLGRAADNLATIQTTTNTTMLQAGESMKNVLTTASDMGFQLEETTALIGAMANVGYKAGVSGTYLMNSLIRLVKTTPKASRMMRKLGIDMRKLAPKGELGFENFLKILDTIEKRAGALEIYTIFERQGGKAMMALKKVGTATIKRLVDLQREGVKLGMATAMAQRQMAGLPGMIVSLKSALEALQITMVEMRLADILVKMGTWFTKTMRHLNKEFPNLMAFVGLFGSLTIAIIATTAAFLILTPVISALMSPVGATIAAVSVLVSLWAAFYKKNEDLQKAFLILQGALYPLWQTIKAFFGMFTDDKIDFIYLLSKAILFMAKALEIWLKPLNLALKIWTKLFNLISGKPAEVIKAESLQAQFMADADERMRLRDMQDMWQKKYLSDVEAVIRGREQIQQQMAETTLNGEIKVSATPGTQVESATLDIMAPGNLGFNMAGS